LLPEKGRIFFEPKHFTKYKPENIYLEPLLLNPNLMKKTIGYSPQKPSFYDKLTCMENLKFFGTLYGISKDIKRINAKILLQLVGLEESAKKKAEQLSGGMQKRLDLACSLIHDPKILVLDEPTSDLDIVLRRQLWDLIKTINKKGTTVIMSSHFLDEIKELSDRIAIIDNCKFKYVGSPKETKRKKESSLIISFETLEKKYNLIANNIKELYKKNKMEYSIKYVENKMILRISKIRDQVKETEKVMEIIRKNKQTLLEFSFEKEGILQIFEDVRKNKSHKKIIKNSIKHDKIKKIINKGWKL